MGRAMQITPMGNVNKAPVGLTGPARGVGNPNMIPMQRGPPPMTNQGQPPIRGPPPGMMV
eukprot:CAMPEP_0176350928 /NCGR_PEP_ID=MMETSP0126-20121128/9838_1 /TAXON_ID=141414 ORGANISM="Strombidinopsis acuminatum, Strain SPMC142" /NCGR_SAMPLE_ID=MMETSP0126 /ASSEMBLY_ACC=CAM_ASM_000229 /LENGTH=59 /DNA_ID=CAMNT_0017701175 /DNA_START=331 /DNA_END=510 /DNA_ORIENTATION=-